jgi:hypothetical protein
MQAGSEMANSLMKQTRQTEIKQTTKLF